MAKILSWDKVSNKKISDAYFEKQCSYIVYELKSLPNFTDYNFDYLSQEVDNRQVEIIRRQITMLNYIHAFAQENWAVSMRLCKSDKRIIFYIVFRYAGATILSQSELDEMDRKIQNVLMNEYSFERSNMFCEAFDISWASQVSEIFKNEEEYRGEYFYKGIDYSERFYVPYMWTQADNDMESICTALMRHQGRAVVEVTIIPAKYSEAERNWISESIRRLKDYINGFQPKNESGEILRDSNGKSYPKSEPQPELKSAIDNFEKIAKNYQLGRLFLTSIRIWGDRDADFLADAFLINSVKGRAETQIFTRDANLDYFVYVSKCYESVDISAKIFSNWWIECNDGRTFSAQRLNRLNSVEEIANFFRIPVPIKSSFPGFDYDTGEGIRLIKHDKDRKFITLGTYNENKFDQSEARFDVQNLAKHGLIVGVPGSGKTTAMFSILYQLWQHKIPFMILEPAKTEYRALKTLDFFRDDILVFSLGDESISPFRFNPLEVPEGIRLESHISKLQACFVGAFKLEGPLPLFLEKALRYTYSLKGWYEDSVGGEKGPETPTLSDLCKSADYMVSLSGYVGEVRSNIKSALVERLVSLCCGSKGRMLDTKISMPMNELMRQPVVLELDSLNSDEKSLVMMFFLSYVYEYCKVNRKSGMKLQHMLFVEEAHNLIGANQGKEENSRTKSLELFVNMLAEMRALGEGIMIADQLPTAIAPQAVKQTNVKILMRITAEDDRKEIGNSMGLDDVQMHRVINFKTGDSFVFHEDEDRVRTVRMLNFKGKHKVEEPPSDSELREMMENYEISRPQIFMPFGECSKICNVCHRRTRAQAESFVQNIMPQDGKDIYDITFGIEAYLYREGKIKTGALWRRFTRKEAERIMKIYGCISDFFGGCVYLQLINSPSNKTGLRSEDFDSDMKKFLEIRRN